MLAEVFGPSEVVAAQVVFHLPDITELKRKKKKALKELDRAEYHERKDGARPTKSTVCFLKLQ